MNHPHQTRYNYQALDRLLTEDSDPVEIGNQLDEIMEALTTHAAQHWDYHTKLEEHYYVLREMRNVFWKLKTLKGHEQTIH